MKKKIDLKKRISSIMQIVKDSNISIVWWGLLFIIVIFLCYTNIYNDILVTAKASYNMWDYIFSGRIGEWALRPLIVPGKYYTIEQSGRYPFVAQFTMSIWMFPMWVFGKIIGHSVYNTVASMIWLKTWILLSYILSGIMVYKIVKNFRSSAEAIRASFIFYSSVMILLSTFIVSQIEIFTCLLVLCGIDAWIEKRRKSFLCFFMLAVGMKYFALLTFIPLLLTDEKRIKNILLYSGIVSLPVLEILFPKVGGGGNAPAYASRFFYAIFNLGPSVLYPFIFTVLIVIILAYLHDSKKHSDDLFFVIICEVVIWGAFCLFLNPNPYWCVLITPFLCLAIGMSDYKKNEMLVLEMMFTCFLSFVHICMFYPVYDARTELEMGIIPFLLGINVMPVDTNQIYMSTFDFFSSFIIEIETVKALSYNVALVCFFVFVYLVWNNYSGKKILKKNIEKKDDCKLCILRLIISIIVGLLPIASFIYFYV